MTLAWLRFTAAAASILVYRAVGWLIDRQVWLLRVSDAAAGQLSVQEATLMLAQAGSGSMQAVAHCLAPDLTGTLATQLIEVAKAPKAVSG